MQAIAIALSAFSSRATRGRRVVLAAYSGLIALVLLGLAQLISVRAREDGVSVDPIGLADMFAMMLLGGALFVVAPAMVASQVAEERRSGTLDLLRTAPISPTALAAGFLAGAPSSLYLLCAGPLALHVLAGLLGCYPIAVLPVSLLIIGLGSAITMLIAMLLAVSVGRDGGGAAPLIVAGLSTFATFVTVGMASAPDVMPWALVHPAGALAALYHSFDGPFRAAFSSPWHVEQLSESRAAAMIILEPILAIGIYATGGALLLSAARRVLAGDVVSRLTKPTALALFILAVVALAVPLRVMVSPKELDLGHLGGLMFALMMPYVACVIGATASVSGSAMKRGWSSASAAPHRLAALMLSGGIAVMVGLYGTRIGTVIGSQDKGAPLAIAFLLLALTLPVYAAWAATRIHAAAGRLAFWALIVVHLSLQVPSIFAVVTSHGGTREIQYLLAQIDVAFGAILPLVIMWRQRNADRRSATPTV